MYSLPIDNTSTNTEEPNITTLLERDSLSPKDTSNFPKSICAILIHFNFRKEDSLHTRNKNGWSQSVLYSEVPYQPRENEFCLVLQCV